MIAWHGIPDVVCSGKTPRGRVRRKAFCRKLLKRATLSQCAAIAFSTSARLMSAVSAALPRAVGPCVWTASELARSRSVWTHSLTAQEIEELDAAVSRCGSADLLSIAAWPEGVDSGAVGAVMHKACHQLYAGHALFLLRGLPVQDWGTERAATAYWLLGLLLGTPVSQNRGGHVLGHVKDVGGDARDPQTRLYQTSVAQPYHTDSCDVVGLLCLQQASSGGDSQVVSSAAIFNALADTRPELAHALLQPFHNDRKGEIPAGKGPTFQMPVFNEAPDGRIVSMYDRSFIKAAHALWPELPPLTDLEVEALDAADSLAASDEFRLDMRLQPGDIQFLHNHAIWHARGAFSDEETCRERRSRRHLLRLWLAAPPHLAWPLPPVFAERYGTVDPHAAPPRGGIRVPGVQLCAPLDASLPV
jgi:Taurine catabolism dioxygenase TauD, TfdA family